MPDLDQAFDTLLSPMQTAPRPIQGPPEIPEYGGHRIDEAWNLLDYTLSPNYSQNQANQQHALADARERHRNTDEGFWHTLGRRAGMGGMELGESMAMREAHERYQRGEATQNDIDNIARQERLGQIAGQRSTGEQIGEAALGLPAMAAQMYGAGGVSGLITRPGLVGGAARLGAFTVAQPSTIAGAMQENVEAGRNALNVGGLAHRFTLDAVRNGIFMAASNPAGGGVAGYFRNLATGMEASEFTKEAEGLLGITTSHGAIGALLEGRHGEAFQHLATDAISIGTLQLMHGASPHEARQAVERAMHPEARTAPGHVEGSPGETVYLPPEPPTPQEAANRLQQTQDALRQAADRYQASRASANAATREGRFLSAEEATAHQNNRQAFLEALQGHHESHLHVQRALGIEWPSAPEAGTTPAIDPHVANSVQSVTYKMDGDALSRLQGLLQRGGTAEELARRLATDGIIGQHFGVGDAGAIAEAFLKAPEQVHHLLERAITRADAAAPPETAPGGPPRPRTAPEAPEPAQPPQRGPRPAEERPTGLPPNLRPPEGPTVLDAVQEAYPGAQMTPRGEIEAHVGEGESARTIYVQHDPARNATRIDFEGTRPGVPLLMQRGSLEVARGLKTLLGRLREMGSDIEYRAIDTNRTQGRSLRADIYARALEKSGFEQVGESEGMITWRPKQPLAAASMRPGFTKPLRTVSAEEARPTAETTIPPEGRQQLGPIRTPAQRPPDTGLDVATERAASRFEPRAGMDQPGAEQLARRLHEAITDSLQEPEHITQAKRDAASDLMGRAGEAMRQAGHAIPGSTEMKENVKIGPDGKVQRTVSRVAADDSIQREALERFNRLLEDHPEAAHQLAQSLLENPKKAREILDHGTNKEKEIVDGAAKTLSGGKELPTPVRRGLESLLRAVAGTAKPRAPRAGGQGRKRPSKAQGAGETAAADQGGGEPGASAAAGSEATRDQLKSIDDMLKAPDLPPEGRTRLQQLRDLLAGHQEHTDAKTEALKTHTPAEVAAAVRDGIQAADLAAQAPPTGAGGQPGAAARTEPTAAESATFGKPLRPGEPSGMIGGGQEGGTPERPLRETALANAKVDQERLARGEPALLRAARVENTEVWDKAMERLDRDPEAGAKLVEELKAKPRTTNVEENALLLQRKIALDNEWKRQFGEYLRVKRSGSLEEVEQQWQRTLDLREKLNDVDKVSRSTGTEWGRAGQFRRQLAAEDFSLTSMMNQFRFHQDREPTPQEAEQIARMHERIAALTQRAEEAERALGALRRRPGEDAVEAGRRAALSPEWRAKEKTASDLTQEQERTLRYLKGRERMSWPQRIGDWFNRWIRFNVLSGPRVVEKLASAAVENMAVITPLEDMVGSALRLVPGLRQVAEKAPRHGGGFSPSIEGKAWKAGVFEGVKDSLTTIKTGRSALDSAHGGEVHSLGIQGESIPGAILDFPGLLHAALKAPPKRAEYERSFLYRQDHAARQGLDATDPQVMQRNSALAYLDAEASIFQNKNLFSQAWNNWLQTFQRGGPGGQVAAAAMRVAMPIVRVPTNIVARTFEYATGLAGGSVRLAAAYRAGINTLEPAQADLIMRNFKRGSVGMAALLTGYFVGPSFFGGFYSGKRKEGEQEPGSIGPIPSEFVHHPLFLAAQAGASIRREQDRVSGGRGQPREQQGFVSGLIGGALELMGELPAMRAAHTVSQLGNPQERGRAIASYLRELTLPSLLQFIGDRTDAIQAGRGPLGPTPHRQPRTLLQNLQMGVPGLRGNVPLSVR